jgi:putative glycosyltransferase (TIGR04372 family)
MEEKARQVAAGLGIDDNTKVVTLHMRERGWRTAGKNPHVEQASEHRNVNIESYLPAIDYLVSQGYMIVRIGDPTMTPISREGLIDIATSSQRNDLLEIYLIMKSFFLITCDSGPPKVAELLNVPTLAVNIVYLIGNYPIRSNCIYILKKVINKYDGKELKVKDIVRNQEYLSNIGNSSYYNYSCNSSSELIQAVQEMFSLLLGEAKQSQTQISYREELIGTLSKMHSNGQLKKWGLENGFLGNGRIGLSNISES